MKYTTTTEGRTAQVYRDNGNKWLARIEADSTEVLRRLVCAVEAHNDLIDQRDALVEAAESQMRLTRHLGDCWECGEGLSCKTYDLMDKEATELTIAALAAAKGEKCTGS